MKTRIAMTIIIIALLIGAGTMVYRGEAKQQKIDAKNHERYMRRVAKLKSIKLKVKIIAYATKTHVLYQDELYTVVKLENGKIKEVGRVLGEIGEHVTITQYDLSY